MTRQTKLLHAILEVTKGNIAQISDSPELNEFCRLATTGKTGRVTIEDFHFFCETAGGTVTWNKTGDTAPRTLKY